MNAADGAVDNDLNNEYLYSYILVRCILDIQLNKPEETTYYVMYAE